MEDLKEIKVPRSLRDRKVEKSSSVHTFVDASNDAYGAVSYLRCEYDQGCYGVSIIASKTKVVSVPVSRDPTWKLNPVKWSSWTSLTRVSAWVANCRASREHRLDGPLTPDEIQEVEVRIIRDAQRTHFAEEFSAIQRNRALPKNSRLSKLTPKLDHDGLLRCDGRLQYADNLPYDVRFPIILPRGNWATKLIVKHFHEAGHHVTGTNHTLANLSSKYWIVAAREEIRDWQKACNECRRRKLKAAD